jgi:hypothetical protein
MDSAQAHSEPGFFASLVKGYLLGTLAAAFALHIAISLIAPGDGGTMLALGSGAILFALILILAIIGIVAFPLAAIISWPLRRLVFRQPFLALALCLLVGTGIGAILTATEFQVGPGDFYSGPVVGFVYGLVWFLVVRTGRRAKPNA